MHTIRLRRPWLRSVDSQPPPDKVDVPDTLPPAAGGGAVVTYRRAFNRPTGLTPNDSVCLSIAHFTADSIEIRINDTLIYQSDRTEPIRLDMTAALRPSNQLAITLTAGECPTTVLDGAVTLEIESIDP
ncbi:hypothetical protein NZK35_27750 [Stieleria sp. ICT_E10.1]|uniref:hypothetical protein n=1 Tax=Stieleria sedimenti TaxID=2976331 RepID=UPI002180080A|nr:hypothetical protein [Stieleria sedimenti]MCS7470463.1 hypothetical protein [Stieleria sedimenti]